MINSQLPRSSAAPAVMVTQATIRLSSHVLLARMSLVVKARATRAARKLSHPQPAKPVETVR
jgi:hypothetical protein